MEPLPPTPAAGAAVTGEDLKLDRRVIMIGSVVVLGAIMAMLDITVVNVALDHLIVEFDSPWTRCSGSPPATPWRWPR